MLQRKWKTGYYLHFTNPRALVEENHFRSAAPSAAPLLSFAEARKLLPQPYWDEHEDAIACWWKAWELAWQHILPATPESGFLRDYIDTAFNGHLFLWDSVFILLFGRYGSHAFNFQQTLDNFYAKQHDDGFICRELRPAADGEVFSPHDPASTGPNIAAWGEWDYFLNSGDEGRLVQVFPVLLAYHRWLRRYRTWPDGSYFQSGLASGMDNQPVDGSGDDVHVEYRHLSRIDANAQALLSAKTLWTMAGQLGRLEEVQPERQEAATLQQLIIENAWNPEDGFFYNWHGRHGRSPLKSAGAYWLLLSDAVPAGQLPRFIAALSDPATFNRPHRVPCLARDNPSYQENGSYWRGGVWAAINYMILRGLTQTGFDELAHDIARNHHDMVIKVFKETGTLWEFYAPETAAHGFRHDGKPAVKDMVGWTGLSPIAVLLEYRFGLRPDVPNGRLLWDIREQDAFGVTRYPFGAEGLLDLHCAARDDMLEKPVITVSGNCSLELLVRWAGGQEQVAVAPS